MRKRIIGVGLACLTAGLVFAGCGASSDTAQETTTSEVPLAETIAETTTTTTAETTTTTEETTTTTEETTTTTEAPTTTTTEVPTTVAEEDVFYLDDERFTGIYLDVSDGMFTGFGEFPPGIVYLNGLKYTGSLDDFPETSKFVVIDSRGRVDSDFDKSYLQQYSPCVVDGAAIEIYYFSATNTAQIKTDYPTFSDFSNGIDVVWNIGNETYTATLRNSEYVGGEANITLDRTYESGQAYTLTATSGGNTVTGTGTIY